MFTIYHSNQLDLLKSLTAELIKREPLNSVFASEVVVVQSQGMAQWIQLQLADELNIAANIEFPFPNQFVWDIYRIFHPNLPQNNNFNTDFITWALMAILPDMINSGELAEITHYFDSDNEQKRYQFAASLARQFDQYLVYRPDWVEAWEKGELIADLHPSQRWQARLWQKLIAYTEVLDQTSINRMELHQTVLQFIKTTQLNQTQRDMLPKRVFIFGIVSLPPLYLELFHALSQHIEIHLMFMNPCRYYWGDIIDKRSLVNNESTSRLLQQPDNQSHPLLLSWGKLGRDHLALLQNYDDKNDIEAFYDSDERSLLISLQQSILNFSTASVDINDYDVFQTSEHKKEISSTDNSITFHACHSEQREVEVLYDHLLSVLDDNPNISINDCVVMVADIDHYAPYIQAVFDNAPKQRYLPYTISDQKLRNIDPTVQGFSLLLELPTRRMEIEYIFDLLDIPAIASHFKLTEIQIKQLQNWVVDSGIRWGLDSNVDEPYGWLIGLKRMLLGYVMDSNGKSWQQLLPYDGPTGLEADLIGLLADFIELLSKWHQILTQQYSISDWQTLCIDLLNDFFQFDMTSEPLLLAIDTHWQAIIEQAQSANYVDKIGITILRDIILAKLEQNQLSHRFLVGKLNFCTMMPMRSVPFKVVCLLGMNDGVYPRITLPLSFDLISHYKPRLGDRSRRNDDRYLFLEAVLSAQQQLYISYIGRNIQTNDLRYPSILVDELFDYLADNYVLAEDKKCDIDSSGKKLLQHLIVYHSRTPFSVSNYHNEWVNNPRSSSYADEWLPAAKGQGQVTEFLSPLSTINIDSVTLDDLKRFYHHPIKQLTLRRLGFIINYSDERLPDAEKFSLNHLESFQVNNQLIEQLTVDSNLSNLSWQQDPLFEKLLRSNQLPYGVFSQILYRQQKEAMLELADKINTEKGGDIKSIDIDMNLSGIRLYGQINGVQDDGILQWRTSMLTIRDGMSLWIDHLAYCATASEDSLFSSRIYGRKNTEWRFLPLAKPEALKLLTELVHCYQIGMSTPFFMPLLSSWKWLTTAIDESGEVCADNNVLNKAQNSFINTWQGAAFEYIAECDDYYFRFYPQLTEDLIINAQNAAKYYLLPIVKYRDL